MNLLRMTVIVAFFACISSRAVALEAAEPGKSLWNISLGSSREHAVAIAQSRFMDLGGKRHSPRTYSNNLIEDEWDFDVPHSDNKISFEVLSQHGKVVQLRTWALKDSSQTNLTFAQLIKRHHLQKRVYGFDDPNGGGYDCFYYDDIKRGICFSLGVQDDFLLTYHPDAVIVHQPGIAAVAIESGIRGKGVTGQNARAFANLAEAQRIEQHNRNDY